MESFILPEPFIPGEDGNGAQLNPRQPELGQDMEVDKDKPDELLERKVMRTPFLTVSMDHFEEQYVLRPYGLQAPQRLPPGYDIIVWQLRKHVPRSTARRLWRSVSTNPCATMANTRRPRTPAHPSRRNVMDSFSWRTTAAGGGGPLSLALRRLRLDRQEG